MHKYMMKITIAAAVLSVLVYPIINGAENNSQDKAFVRAPLISKAPAVNGTVGDAEWKKAARFTNFLLCKDGQPASEQTFVWLAHDKKNIYIGFRMMAFALNPESNLTDSFKAAYTGRDKAFWDDEVVEFKIKAPNSQTQYFFAFNANGSLLDMKKEASSWDKKWNSAVKIAAAKNSKGYWEAELAIPFSDFANAELQGEWQFMCTRFEKRLGETSSWNRIYSGNHQDFQECAGLTFGDSSLAAREIPLSPQTLKQQKILLQTVAAAGTVISWESGFFCGTKPEYQAAKSVSLKPGTEVLGIDVPLKAVKDNRTYNFQYLAKDAGGKLVFRSPARPFSGASSKLKIALEGSEALEIYWNGEKISSAGKNIKSEQELRSGRNVIAIKIPAGGKISGSLACFNENLKLDGAWKYALNPENGWEKINSDDRKWGFADSEGGSISAREKGDGFIVFRKTILNRVSRLFPDGGAQGWHLSENGTYFLSFRGNGAEVWEYKNPLEDFKIIIQIPPELELLSGCGPKFVESASAKKLGRQQMKKDLEFNEWKMKELPSCRHAGKEYKVYEFSSQNPFMIEAGYDKWFWKRIVGQAKALYLAVKARPGTAGKNCTIYHHAEAFGGAFRELSAAFPVRIIEEIKGRQPKKINIFAVERAASYKDPDACKKYLDTIRNAGVTEIFSPSASPLIKSTGLKQINFFNLFLPDKYTYTSCIIDPAELFEAFPESVSVKYNGKTGRAPCMVWLTENIAKARPFLEKEADRIRQTYPSLDKVLWDYEYPPIPDKGSHCMYPCFSEYALAAFAKKYGIKEKLSAKIIVRKYRDKFIDFSCRKQAEMCRILRDIFNKHNIKFTVYCGYECPFTHWRYGINWNYAGPEVDDVYCGYGRNLEKIDATLKALKKTPLSGGLLTRGFTPQNHTPAQIIRKIIDCRGGVLLWYEGPWDARSLQAIAESSKAVAEYEDFLVKGERIDGTVSVQGTVPGNIALLKLDGKAALWVLNPGEDKIKVNLAVPSADGKFSLFGSGKEFDSNNIQIEIEAGKFAVFAGNAPPENAKTAFDDGNSLLKNGSFEELDGKKAKFWENGPYNAYSVTDEKAYSGKYCLKLSAGAGAPHAGRSSALQKIKIEPGAKYLVTMKFFIEKLETGCFMPFYTTIHSKKGKKRAGSTIYRKSIQAGKWQDFNFLLDMSKYPGAKGFTFSVMSWNNGKRPFKGTVYFDDLIIRKIK
jgi:hypothetical protein